jgi:hypothetical protein
MGVFRLYQLAGGSFVSYNKNHRERCGGGTTKACPKKESNVSWFANRVKSGCPQGQGKPYSGSVHSVSFGGDWHHQQTHGGAHKADHGKEAAALQGGETPPWWWWLCDGNSGEWLCEESGICELCMVVVTDFGVGG